MAPSTRRKPKATTPSPTKRTSRVLAKNGRKVTPTKAASDDASKKYIAKARRDATGKLLKNVKKNPALDMGIEHNVKSIRAILAMNSEIWERCQPSLVGEAVKDTTQFARYEYKQVTASQSAGSLIFQACIEHTKYQFDIEPLCNLPPKLAVFSPEYLLDKTGCMASVLLDLEHVFQKAFILHDDVLEPFLVHLKEHVERVQVCLGKIDAWLMEPQAATEFLETAFGQKLEQPNMTSLNEGSYGYNGQNYYSGIDTQQRWISLNKSVVVSGTMSTSFDVSDEEQRKKLTKFLDFVSA